MHISVVRVRFKQLHFVHQRISLAGADPTVGGGLNQAKLTKWEWRHQMTIARGIQRGARVVTRLSPYTIEIKQNGEHQAEYLAIRKLVVLWSIATL